MIKTIQEASAYLNSIGMQNRYWPDGQVEVWHKNTNPLFHWPMAMFNSYQSFIDWVRTSKHQKKF